MHEWHNLCAQRYQLIQKWSQGWASRLPLQRMKTNGAAATNHGADRPPEYGTVKKPKC